MRLYCSDTYRVLRLSRVCGACIFSTGERGSLRRLVRRRIRDGSISALASSCGSAIVLATPQAARAGPYQPYPYLPRVLGTVYRTCATFEIGDLLRSGTTSHLTGTTQLTEVPDLNRSRSQE